MDARSDTLRVDVESGVCTLRMNRPHALNACNAALWQALRDAFRQLAGDASVRAVLLTGEGRAFCVGADLKESVWTGETREQSRARIDDHQQRLTRLIHGLPVPVIAAINGYALGGGLETALACDLRIASDAARLGFPESGVGSSITGGASVLLPAIVGLPAAKRLLFTGARLDAAQALAIGLVDEVVAPDALLPAARRLCDEIARNAPLSVRAMKRLLHRPGAAALDAALDAETEALLGLYGTRDHREGSAAFAERRAPVFEGR